MKLLTYPTEIQNAPAVQKPVKLHSKEWFIEKFAAIHEDFWCAGRYRDADGARCVVSYCGGPFQEETYALYLLLGCDCPETSPQRINDGETRRYQQPTPKARILAALCDLPDTE